MTVTVDGQTVKGLSFAAAESGTPTFGPSSQNVTYTITVAG